MNVNDLTPLSIDQLCTLADTNKEEFEVEAKKYITTTINRMCGVYDATSDEETKRLAAMCVWRANSLLSRVNKETKSCKNPLVKAAKANAVMMNKFLELNQLLQDVANTLPMGEVHP